MEDKKIDWGQYTKAELIEILQYVEKGLTHFMPFALTDAFDKIKRRRLEALQEEARRYSQEAHEARMEAIRLQNTGRTTTRTLQKIEKLWIKASELDRKYAATEVKIDALLVIGET